MRSAAKSPSPRLTRWEILGAWLHVWTAPKGIDVPPIPWRKVAIYGVAAALVAGAVLAITIPRVDEGKRKGAAERARQEAAAIAAERARLAADQRVHRLTAAAGTPLVTALERGIKADAAARAKAGTLGGPVLSASCERAGEHSQQFPGSQVYKCFVKTSTGQRGQGNDILGSGYPFVATIYTADRKLAWCKQNPQPDEKGRRLVGVRLSAECAGRLRAVL